MNINPNIASCYLNENITNGSFNAIKLIKELSNEKHIWIDNLTPVMVSFKIFKTITSAYEFKKELWNNIKIYAEFQKCEFEFQFLREISFEELNDKTHSHNLLSAIIDYVKQKIEGLIKDIDDDVLEHVLKETKKQMENENE